MRWFEKNFRTLIYIAFLVPILTVAFVSISHVTMWYGISNPLSWAIYLSVGIEIAALSALAAISANMGRKVYFPFGIVTLIQFIGNIYFAFQFIDIDSKSFRDWVSLVDPIVSLLGVEEGNLESHKRFLAFFAGGMLPIISLSFLHMLVKFEEEEKKKNKTSETEMGELESVFGENFLKNEPTLTQEPIQTPEPIKTFYDYGPKTESKNGILGDLQELADNLSELSKFSTTNLTNPQETTSDHVEPTKERKTLSYKKRDGIN